MSALDNDRMTPTWHGVDLCRRLDPVVNSGSQLYAGALAAIDIADEAGEAIPAAASLTQIVVGKSETRVLGDGAKRARISEGAHCFENSATVDAISQNDLGKPAFAVDDQTVALTDAGGTRPPVGVILGMIGTFPVVLCGVLAQAVARALNAALLPVQSGSGTLVAGVLTVTSAVIRAGSVITATYRTAAGTPGVKLACPTADRTVGIAGASQFRVRSYSDGTTAATSDTSTVDWQIIG